jgi:predicted nucleic acid-binding protein
VSSVYAETSAVLAWLLGESTAEQAVAVINGSDSVLTSALTAVEVHRSLVRAQATGVLSEAAAGHLEGVFETISLAWIIMEMSPGVRERASMRFPVEPVRSLDAIHLATALEFHKAVSDMKILSFDARIVNNLDRLGLERAL